MMVPVTDKQTAIVETEIDTLQHPEERISDKTKMAACWNDSRYIPLFDRATLCIENEPGVFEDGRLKVQCTHVNWILRYLVRYLIYCDFSTRFWWGIDDGDFTKCIIFHCEVSDCLKYLFHLSYRLPISLSFTLCRLRIFFNFRKSTIASFWFHKTKLRQHKTYVAMAVIKINIFDIINERLFLDINPAMDVT
jgi:hypothetical protein